MEENMENLPKNEKWSLLLPVQAAGTNFLGGVPSQRGLSLAKSCWADGSRKDKKYQKYLPEKSPKNSVSLAKESKKIIIGAIFLARTPKYGYENFFQQRVGPPSKKLQMLRRVS